LKKSTKSKTPPKDEKSFSGKKPPDSITAGREVMDETRAAFQKAGFTVEKIAEEMAIMAFSDPANHADIAEGGELRFKTFKEQGDRRRALKKIKEKTVITESKDGEKIYKTSTVEWELHDKPEMLIKGAAIVGIVPEQKVKVEIPGLEETLRKIHEKRAKK